MSRAGSTQAHSRRVANNVLNSADSLSRAPDDDRCQTSSMSHLARTERHELCTTMLRLGPQAPTLCEGWQARDLAAHLVVRDRRPDALLGLVLPPLAEHTESLQRAAAAQDWTALVEQVRSGPPRWSPTRWSVVDDAANTAEMFVHHEDLLRAEPDWQQRQLTPELQRALWGSCKVVGRAALRRAPVGVELVAPGYARVTARKAHPSVRVQGAPAELLLFAFGRRSVARVDLDGADSAVQQLSGPTSPQ